MTAMRISFFEYITRFHYKASYVPPKPVASYKSREPVCCRKGFQRWVIRHPILNAKDSLMANLIVSEVLMNVSAAMLILP